MTLSELVNMRLVSQQLATSKFKTPKGLVSWMGAMQAQEFKMAKWAVGIRTMSADLPMIEAAISDGSILRTHLLRPTWHLVSADDIYRFLDLTAPRLKAAQKTREKQLGLTEEIFKKSNSVIKKALGAGQHLNRVELIAKLVKAHIAVDNNRSSHILFNAELEGIVCSGAIKNKQHTYALLPERVPGKKIFPREESLAILAQKYFESHGPATLPDFTWWSGLSAADARLALEIIKPGLISEKMDSRIYWFSPSLSIPQPSKSTIYLLPAFDEFIISYKDRSAALLFKDHQKAVSNNGIFRPIIVMNGKVEGIWKSVVKKDTMFLKPDFFAPVNQKKKI